jgi:hypothetical protein
MNLAKSLALLMGGGAAALVCAGLFACGGATKELVSSADAGTDACPSCADGGSDGRPPDPGMMSQPSYPAGSIPPAAANMDELPYDVVDAKVTDALSFVVLASSTPQHALHLVSTSGGAARTIPLPAAPTGLAVDATGTRAAVAHDGNVSLVDLAAGTVTKSCPTTVRGSSVALSVAGRVFMADSTGIFRTVDLDSCAETKGGAQFLTSFLALAPSEDFLLAASANTSGILWCTAAGAMPGRCNGFPGSDPSNKIVTCDRIWTEPTTKQLITACGGTFGVTDATTDGGTAADAGPAPPELVYGSAIEGAMVLEHAARATSAKRIASIEFGGSTNKDSAVRLSDTDFGSTVGLYRLPVFAHPAPTAQSNLPRGMFAFPTPDATRIFVVVRGDSYPGAKDVQFGLVTLTP